MQFDYDPEAFGVNTVPNPPSDLEKESAYSEVDDSASESSCESVQTSTFRRRAPERPNKWKRRCRRAVVAAAAVGGIMALAKRKA